MGSKKAVLEREGLWYIDKKEAVLNEITEFCFFHTEFF